MYKRYRQVGIVLFGFLYWVMLCPLLHTASAQQIEESIQVEDQAILGGMIVVTAVNILQPRLVIVQLDNQGLPGTLLGWASVDPTAPLNIGVNLNGQLPTGTRLWVTLYQDVATIGSYDNAIDRPVLLPNSSTAVMRQITITSNIPVPSKLPATATHGNAQGMLVVALALLSVGVLVRIHASSTSM